MSQKALIAMSGGVDSSVAAWLIREKGYDCAGATMRLFRKEEMTAEPGCCTSQDMEDARAVADMLGMPYYVYDFADRFRKAVIDRFVEAYENGRTPNPCIDCNRYLKFEELFLRGRQLGCDFVVTGHYARTGYDEKSGRYLLKKAADTSKDQSYVLYSLTQDQLSHVQFPLGELTKQEVRQIAREHGFLTADKAESQDICFVQDGKYYEFICDYTGRDYPAGDFIDTRGKVLGRHQGIIRYTVGQRKGLGIAFGEPVYVMKVDPEANTVMLGTNEELFTDTVTAKKINLISTDRIREPLRVKAKVRYRHKEQWATATQPDEDTLQVVFDEPQRAVTAGQALVLYDGDVVVGGGTIV